MRARTETALGAPGGARASAVDETPRDPWRGVRVGEASHPGPEVRKRDALRAGGVSQAEVSPPSAQSVSEDSWTAWSVAVYMAASAAFIAVASYTKDASLQARVGVEPVYVLMGGIACWIVFLEVATDSLSNFASRKLCHSGCGLGMSAFDTADIRAKFFVWAVAVSSIMMTWGLSPLSPFRFSQPRDVGVTVYLTVVAAWFFFELPVAVLAPVFFADPAGAVIGKFCSRHFPGFNAAWYGQKTIAGSLAVAVFTFATIGYPCTFLVRGVIATFAMLAEAVGEKYDNLALAAVVLVGWAFSRD